MKKNIIVFLFLVLTGYSQNFPAHFKDWVIYYNNFEDSEINPFDIKEEMLKKESIIEKGFIGKSYLSYAKWEDGIILISDKLSPHKSLSISVWWALKDKHKEGGWFEILSLTGKGYISVFTRGGGGDTWCGLTKPAGILQVYNFQGINNINGIYHYDIESVLELEKWNNTVITFTAGRNIKLYHNGQLFTEYNLSGGNFKEEDKINSLSFGRGGGEEIYFDEILILSRVLTYKEINEYYNIMTQLKEMSILK